MSSPKSPLRESYAPPLIAFLRELGADGVKHSGRTFLDHLVGTAAFLEKWGCDDEVCKAGLFHSIYGTEYFHGGVLSFEERDRVRKKLGARAERLAWIFCAFDRRSVYAAIAKEEPYSVQLLKGGGPIPITKQELVELVALVWSNAIEQALPQRFTAEGCARTLRALEQCRMFMPKPVNDELREFYAAPVVSAP